MPRRLTNLLLLALVAALIASGVLGWTLPETPALYAAHRALGAALVALLLWKQVIARRSLARRLWRRRRWDSSVLAGLLSAAAVLFVLAVGLGWTLGVIDRGLLGGYSPLNLHVLAGLILVPPLLVWHALRRGKRRPAVGRLFSRRSALRLLALGGLTLAGWTALERVAQLVDPDRRASGSKHAGSFTGNAFPETIWLLDAVPALAAESWRLVITGRVQRPLTLGYDHLIALPQQEVVAVLDCTSGWWSAQRWRGVPLAGLLALAGPLPAASGVTIISCTGHRWTFPLAEAGDLLLATYVGGEALSPGHGYPARLVAPGRRGFQWIKWVERLELS